MNLPAIVLVSGTDTGVGKTVTTAALAAALLRQGRTVAVYKPCQTGSACGDSDIAEVARLAGPTTAVAGVVLRDPLAPRAAAELDGVTLPTVSEHAGRIRELAETHEHVLVEGAGGVLVELDEEGRTLADLGLVLMAGGDEADGAELAGGARPGYVVVTRPGLGTLNHTALTLEALDSRGLPVLGVVVGSLPEQPGVAERGNMEVLANGAVPLIGAIPAGASLLPPQRFQEDAGTWLAGPGFAPTSRQDKGSLPAMTLAQEFQGQLA